MTRKLLLILFALAVVFSASAHKVNLKKAEPAKHQTSLSKNYIEKESMSSYVVPPSPLFPQSKGDFVLSKTLIGSARNIFSGLLSFQTCLTYNDELNALMFTHRGNDKGSIVPLATGNDIVSAFSSNGGTTFDQKIALANGASNRYTSGVFVNPNGNTDTTNTYYLVARPVTVNNVWSSMYLHTKKYDGTNEDHQEIATDPTFLELMRNGLAATTDDKVHIGTNGTTLNSAQTGYTACKLFQLNGDWNTGTNKVDWGAKIEITPNLVAKPSDNTLYLDGSFSQVGWSKDGTVGYLLMLGADNRPTDKPTIAPMLWKSTDGGDTWTMVDYFDWSTLPAIRDNIFPTKFDTTVYKPYFEEASIVVDGMGKPHIFGLCRGGYSANLDSLSYIYIRSSTQTIMDGNIVELYLDDSDTWQGNWIDSISADAVTSEKSPYVYSPNNVGWDHRLSAGVSNDGSRVFCTWTDSDWIFWGTEAYDLNPDVKGWEREITMAEGAGVMNFTANTDLWGLAFFHFMSPQVMPITDGYEFPIVITDINTTGLQATEPVYYYYVQGCDIITTGVKDQQKANSVVSTCYPNPFTDMTKVNVTPATASNVTISISDLTGKLVSTTNYGTLPAGKHTLTIDGRQLHTGIYFYTVTVGDQKFNNKMIVK